MNTLRTRRHWTACLLLLLLSAGLPARGAVDPSLMYFNHFTPEEGLPADNVLGVEKDPKGYLWIATSNGLARFDGLSFSCFGKEDLKLPSAYIRSLFSDPEGHVWVNTPEGVSVYDPARGTFSEAGTLLGTQIPGPVTASCTDEDGRVWIALRNQGILEIEPGSWRCRRHFYPDEKQSFRPDVTALSLSRRRPRCPIGLTHKGLWVTDTSFTRLVPFTTADGTVPFNNAHIKAILPDGDDSYFICSGARSIYRIDLAESSCERLEVSLGMGVKVRDLVSVSPQVIAILTNAGLFLYDTSDGTLARTGYDPAEKNSLPGNSVLDLEGNLQDGLILAMGSDGLAIQLRNPLSTRRVRSAVLPSGGSLPLSGSHVCGFAEDAGGTIWVATEQQGLFTYRPDTDMLTPYVGSGRFPKLLITLSVLGDNVWVSSTQGLFRIPAGGGEAERFRRYSPSVVAADAEGNPLLGGDDGLTGYDPELKGFRHLFQPPLSELRDICDILTDSEGRIWYATRADGLWRQDDDSVEKVRLRTEDGEEIHWIHALSEDAQGRVWAVIPERGLARIEEDGTAVFPQKGARHSEALMWDALEGGDGDFWCTTNDGLLRMGPDGSFSLYNRQDGLLDDRFTPNAAFRARDGRLYLGSRNGFVILQPGNARADIPATHLEVCDFFLGKKRVDAETPGSPLHEAICDTRRLVLRHNQNSFGVQLALTGPASYPSGEVRYRLDNYDSDWTLLRAGGSISYSNVPPGRYLFRATARSIQGNWQLESRPLKIIIRPPLYRSAVAGVVYALLLAGSLLLLLLRYRRRENARRQAQELSMKLTLNDEKVRFYTTVAHEIKTPLTLIQTPIKHILEPEQVQGELGEDLQVIEKNAGYLGRLIDELLDFSRFGSNEYALSCTRLDLGEEVQVLGWSFQGEITARSLQYNLQRPDAPLWIQADRSALAKILNNLFLNAVKYAASRIDIHLEQDGDRVRAVFSNDGPVVPIERRSAIFEPFVQDDAGSRSRGGFGIGLSVASSLCHLHGGSLEMDSDLERNNFILTFPLSPDALIQPDDGAPSPDVSGTDPDRTVVLLVEDDEGLREWLKGKLEARYHVLTAANGEEALSVLATEERVDVVIADIVMPKMDGITLCSRLREDFETSHLIIIILSANLDESRRITSMKSGADMVMEKPFSLDFLISCIDSLVRGRALLFNRLIGAQDETASPVEEPAALPDRDKLFFETLNRKLIENLSNPDYSIGLLASELNVSTSHLSRKIKSMTRHSFVEYVRELRLTRSEALLRKGELRVAEIAYSVGFQTPSYFIKRFKEKYGRTPKEYLAEHFPESKDKLP